MDQPRFEYGHTPSSPLDRGELTKEEKKIMDILQICKGKDKAILGAKISELTGIIYDEVRAIISHLVNEHHALIASYSKGYFMPITDREVEEAAHSLRHRGIMILMRASRLQATSLENVFYQGKLEYGNN